MATKSSGDVRAAIAAMFADDLPARLERVRELKTLDEHQVPDVTQIHDGQTPDEAFSGNAKHNRVWVVVTNPRHVPPMRSVDWRNGLPVYEIKYACQIEVWALGTSWDNALRVRDEIESAVRFSLIDNANLSTDHSIETGYALHPPSVMSQFGIPVRMNNTKMTWAPALVSVDMRVEDAMADSVPNPPKPFDGIGLYFVKMPTDDVLGDLSTEQGREQMKEWTYGEAEYAEELGG